MDLIIKTTQRCNFACTFCSSTNIAQSNKVDHDLDINKVIQFLERFPDTKTIIVNGGDPLMVAPKIYSYLLEYLATNKLPAELHFITNLWDWYVRPEKWHDIFMHPKVKIATSFNYGDTRRITTDRVLTEDIFIDIVNKFNDTYDSRPGFISVITEDNEHTALDNVLLAKSLNVECKLNYAMASGREGRPYPIGKMYNTYLDVYEAGLTEWEFNTQQMLKRIQGSEITMCPQNRRCDEGIRNLQPQSESGYEYGSCGSFGDDQEYGIDFKREMAGEMFTPLQDAYELHHLKDECLTCPAFNICNGCYKTVRDLKKADMVEDSCKEMKRFMSRATALGLR